MEFLSIVSFLFLLWEFGKTKDFINCFYKDCLQCFKDYDRLALSFTAKYLHTILVPYL